MLIEALIADLAPVTEVKINKKTQSKRKQEEAKQYNKIIKESMVAGLMVDDVKSNYGCVSGYNRCVCCYV